MKGIILAGIRDILIISKPVDLARFEAGRAADPLSTDHVFDGSGDAP